MSDEFDLSDVPDKELLDELNARFKAIAEREKQFRKILECSARIAFGDFTDLPRLKLLFNDANVYSAASGQLEFLLDSE